MENEIEKLAIRYADKKYEVGSHLWVTAKYSFISGYTAAISKGNSEEGCISDLKIRLTSCQSYVAEQKKEIKTLCDSIGLLNELFKTKGNWTDEDIKDAYLAGMQSMEEMDTEPDAEYYLADMKVKRSQGQIFKNYPDLKGNPTKEELSEMQKLK
jgi:hypothetical protein